MFPEFFDTTPLRRAIDSGLDWVIANWGAGFEAAAFPLQWTLNMIERGLLATPWWAVIGVLVGIAYAATRKIALPAAVLIALLFLGFLELWEDAIKTMALMLTATLGAIAISIPLGVVMSGSPPFRRVVTPVLDLMQTLPSFVYLIPAVMIFGPGKVPAVLATIFYAAPPLMRLTALGIRLVDPDMNVLSSTSGSPDNVPVLDPDWALEVIETGRAAISGVRQDSGSGQWVVSIGVPVQRRGRLKYVLGVRVYAKMFGDILRRRKGTDEGVVTLLDRRTVIVARSRNEDRYVGRPPTPDFAQRSRQAPEGSWRTVLLEGTAAYSAWTRSPLSGWTIGIGLPAAPVDGPIDGESERRHGQVAPRADPDLDIGGNGGPEVGDGAGDDHDVGHAPQTELLAPSKDAPALPHRKAPANGGEDDHEKQGAERGEEKREEEESECEGEPDLAVDDGDARDEAALFEK